MEEQEIRESVSVRNDMGLHARPAAQLAKEASKFQSRISLEFGDIQADAKSILDILSLAANKGKTITVSASGEDAREAIEHLKLFFSGKVPEK